METAEVTWYEWLEEFRAHFATELEFSEAYCRYPCEAAHKNGVPPRAAFEEYQDNIAVENCE